MQTKQTTFTDHTPHRIYLWDNLKFILIFLVVFGHFIHNYTDDSMITEKLYTYICSFHMPAFLFISGLFSKKAIKTKNYRKCFEFFVLYVFTKFCIFLSKIITDEDYSLSLLDEGSVPWYAFALMAFFLMTMFLQQLHPMYLFGFALIMGCISGYDEDINDFFVSSRIIVFYPFFLAGFFLDAKKIATLATKWYTKIAALAVHILWLTYLWNAKDATVLWHPMVTGREHLDEIGTNYFWYRLLYYAVAFILIFSVIALAPIGKHSISGMGSRSIQVYSLHRGFIYLFYYYMPAEDLLNMCGEVNLHFVLLGLSLLLTLLLSIPALARPLQLVLKPNWIKTPPMIETHKKAA